MVYQVLARKWRPRTFDEVVGQAHITRALKSAIVRQKFGHAYLLAGTRGVGKTSIARIIAKAIRCEELQEGGNPCLLCSSCISIEKEQTLDVLEIDGASNNGVEHVRQLIENLHYLPMSGRFKIYIIDEVHMLSKEAFNALLKALEAPPLHVLFIFATTMPEKILETVRSRCIRFDFKTITENDLQEHLLLLAEKEGIPLQDKESLRSICIEARGSVRDALSLFDQVLSYAADSEVISSELVAVALGLPQQVAIRRMLGTVLDGETLACSELLRNLLREGVEVRRIIQALLDDLYNLIQETLREGKSNPELFWIYENLVKDLGWAIESISPEKVTEIILQKISLRRTFFKTDKRDPSVPNEKEREILLSNPVIKEAEKIFGSTVEKIFLKSEMNKK